MLMRALGDFVKTTVLGGLLVILPIAGVAALAVKLIKVAMAFVAPVVSHLPAGTHLPNVMSLLLVFGGCFVAGLLARSTPGRCALEALERRGLEHVPGYTIFRSVARRMVGVEEGTAFAPALAVIEEALVPAFVVEAHDDGQFTVFVPAVPTLGVGSVYILPGDRVHLLDVSFARAVGCISRWGVGSRDLLVAMKHA
jgi:uncharacterized membrane protein